MSDSTDDTTTPAPAAPATDATPQANSSEFPADTPVADMAPDAQAAYWRAQAQKHEKLWKSAKETNPKEIESLREKAKRFDEFEESQKSETQKAVDRAAAAEAKIAEIETRALRAEVAADKGIPAALLSGATKEDLEASADALLAFRGEKPKPDFGAGDRGADVGARGKQLTKGDLSSMTHAEINEARRAGRLDDLLRP
jgi:hypothetical protein